MITQHLVKGGLSRVTVTCAFAGCTHQVSVIGVPPRIRTESPTHGQDKCAEALADHTRVCHRGVQ